MIIVKPTYLRVVDTYVCGNRVAAYAHQHERARMSRDGKIGIDSIDAVRRSLVTSESPTLNFFVSPRRGAEDFSKRVI